MKQDLTWKQEVKLIALASGMVGLLALGIAGSGGQGVPTNKLSSNAITQSENVVTYPQSTTGVVDWNSVVKKVSPALVSVRVRGSEGQSIGSGVVLNKEGDIITNHHVVHGGGSNLEIQVLVNDSAVYNALVVKTDPKSDLAVIRLQSPPSDLTPIAFGSSENLQQGDRVMALGSPLGLSNTVTDGIVSAVDRPVSTRAGGTNSAPTVISAIQTNAAINKGNSGGPLVDSSGRLVGINSSIATTGDSTGNIGIGFAIPADMVAKVVNHLKKGSEYPYGRLGVMVNEGSGRVGDSIYLGATVQEVSPNSAASRAGLKPYDVIVSVNERRVTSQSALVGLVNSFEAGDKVSITYLRNGVEKTMMVELGSASPSV